MKYNLGILIFILLFFSCTLNVNQKQSDADNCAAVKKRAQEIYNEGKYEDAQKHFELALQYCGDDMEVITWIAKCDTAIIENLFDMVYVEGGTFTMGCTAEQGSDCEDDEKPAHRVILSGYYIGRTEVTLRQWDTIMGKNNGHGDWTTEYGLGDNYPVYRVSWYDIQPFLTKLNNIQSQYTFRLPTEAEWEFAARGGNKSRGYIYSGSNNASEVAWFGNSYDKVHPVGKKGGNELGLYDMSGNVWEWCQDWHGGYSINAQTNPKGPSTGSYRVFRGGSWNYLARYARVSIRNNNGPDFRNNTMGFRLACSPR